MIPVGLHNLSKIFRPNLSKIIVLYLGTKFIHRWKFEKRDNAFIFYKDFIRIMQNFKCTSRKLNLDFLRKNPNFKVKTNWEPSGGPKSTTIMDKIFLTKKKLH